MDSIPQFLIAAPTSGSGKTTVSRGLMALFVKKGLKVQPFKCGPDYIDTKYHEAVCGRPSVNLDTFMASQEHVSSLYARYSADADVAVVEGFWHGLNLQFDFLASENSLAVSSRPKKREEGS